ncbi:glycosyltransferase [Paenibacillus swuensis]|nr:glycosyltransferase [Paenibacillus swuensis]
MAYPADIIPINRDLYMNATHPKGINLIGYSRAEMGIGESCRIAARSISATEVPFSIINYEYNNPARMQDHTWIHKEVNQAQFKVNIFHLNADQMIFANAHLGNSFFTNHYNIGYWHWELPDFPDEWKIGFNLVHEVWAPSNFVADSIKVKSPVPVITIPHSIFVDLGEVHFDRVHFNLPTNRFLFMSMYDVHSFQERKNPKAVIRAFQEAYSPEDESVGLVLKVNNASSNPGEIKDLVAMIGTYTNIFIIKETLSRTEMNGLMNVIDCFVSLHRSEGFGLGLAEAMFLGKAVIGTNWSSNTDFMNPYNSCVVNYKLVKVGRDYGPYKAYQDWADPDTSHASEYMSKLSNDSEYYKSISRAGQETMLTEYSPQRIGQLIKDRLKEIQLY